MALTVTLTMLIPIVAMGFRKSLLTEARKLMMFIRVAAKTQCWLSKGARKHVLACYLHIAASSLVLQVLCGSDFGLSVPL